MARRPARRRKIDQTRLSLHPLTPEEALKGFMSVDPAKLKKPAKRAPKKTDH